MKREPNRSKTSTIEGKNEKAIVQPSPELASFLELIGRALAQEWIQQTANRPHKNRADTMP
jgi:hypothetical protein